MCKLCLSADKVSKFVNKSCGLLLENYSVQIIWFEIYSVQMIL